MSTEPLTPPMPAPPDPAPPPARQRRGRRSGPVAPPAGLARWLGKLLGAGAVPAPPNAFALRPDRLAFAGFGREASGYALREQHVEQLGPESFQHGLLGGPLREPAAFGNAVERLVERIGAPVKEASLTVPDAWLRIAFAESGELPARADERDEVLRWKLKRLVPFRVEELRVDAAEVPPLPGQQEPRRLLLGFAIEPLLAQLESAFAGAGVRLGRITGESLALLAAVDLPEAASDRALAALALVDDAGYALLFAREGRPLLHRYKAAAGAPASGPGARGAVPFERRLVVRDLALTRDFLAEQVPGATISRVVLAAPPEVESAWREWLDEGLGVSAEPLGPEHLPPLSVAGPAPVWRELAPLLGAVREEVM